MSDLIQAKYDALDEVAGHFGNQSQATAQTIQALQRAMQPLQNGGWIGRGSDAFFAEMESDVLPAVQRLAQALAQANAVTSEISQLLQEADEEASSGFRNGASGGDLVSGAGYGDGSGGGAESGMGRAVGGPGGSFRDGRFVGTDPGSTWLDNLINDRGFGGGTPFSDGSLGGSDYGIPRDWLSGVSDSLRDYADSGYNDYGIPRDWLADVRNAFGGGDGNDYGIPHDWLADVRDAFAGDSAGSGGGNSGGDSGGGSGSESGGGSGSGSGGGTGGGSGGGSESGAGTGSESSAPAGGSGGGSNPQSSIRDPFGRGGGFGPNSFATTAGAETAGDSSTQGARLRHTSVGAFGGGATTSPAHASPSVSRAGGAGGVAAGETGGGFGIPIGIAAASPFLALLGKALKDRSDKDD